MSKSEQDKPSAFGRGLRLADGDLQLIDGELALVAGRDNLLQGLLVMIETPLGTDVFNVGYGFDLLNIMSRPNGLRFVKEMTRLNIVKSLSRDDRVREIKEVVFDDDPRFFELNPGGGGVRASRSPDAEGALAERRQQHKAARRWQAVVVIETVPGGEAVLQLEGVGL